MACFLPELFTGIQTTPLHSYFLTSVYDTLGCRDIKADLSQEHTDSGRRKKWPPEVCGEPEKAGVGQLLGQPDA